MGLETGDFLDDLVQANPVTASDSVTQGADHIRLLKKVLQQTFGLMDGLLQFPTNNVYLKQSNVAASGFINMIKVNASNQVEVGGALVAPTVSAKGKIDIVASEADNVFEFRTTSPPATVPTDFSWGLLQFHSQDASGQGAGNVATIQVIQRLGSGFAKGTMVFSTASRDNDADPIAALTINEVQDVSIDNGSLTVSGALTLTAGNIVIGAGLLTVGGTVTPSGGRTLLINGGSLKINRSDGFAGMLFSDSTAGADQDGEQYSLGMAGDNLIRMQDLSNARDIFIYNRSAHSFQVSGAFIAVGTITTTEALTCGTLTSTGIDDNATGERLQITDSTIAIGPASGATGFNIHRVNNDASLVISGGSGPTLGANIVFIGGAHASAANDFNFRAGAVTVLAFDSSALIWNFQANAIIATGNLTIAAITASGAIASDGDITAFA